MKKNPFPSEKELAKVRKELSKGMASRLLPDDASAVDRLKFELCEKFVAYRAKSGLTQKELAQKIGIDTALMSKMLHYHVDEFTVDRLMRYLAELHKNLKVSVKVA
jgi:predicted XRE-type DNA-binding protein